MVFTEPILTIKKKIITSKYTEICLNATFSNIFDMEDN